MTKNGLRGFAGGLIISSSILAVIYFQDPVQSSQAEAEKIGITDQDIEAYLAENEFVAVDKEEYETLINIKEEEAKAASAESTEENEQDAPSAEEEEKAEDKPVAVTLNITEGMSTGEVCSFLEEANIIEDSDALLDHLLDNELEGLVRMGSYKVDSSMSIEEIAEEIT
jgi:hypothetical protein